MKAILLGASGLIGNHLLQFLLEDERFENLTAIVRKPLSITHPKLKQQVVDFNNPAAFKNAIPPADVIFCCIGTTQKKMKGDKIAYRKIDYDIAVQAAQFAIAAGIKKYLLVSAIGANAKSRNFYLQLKGEVEEAIAAMPFETLGIIQPSLLTGQRAEKRTGEKIVQVLMPLLNPLLLGSLRKYRSVKAETVAKAMYQISIGTKQGVHRYTYNEIKMMAK
jgi:uncharacterized protein YbjT (DUF2867 family)